MSYQATDKLALKAELSLGRQNRVVTAATGNQDNAQWWGLALYSRYALTDKWGVTYRFELYRDKDAFSTFTYSGSAATATSTVWGSTLSTDYKIYDNLLGRVEYRFDKANEGTPFGSSSQSTLGAQLIYSFA